MGHYQEIQKYGPLPLLQCIQDDNPTFHPLKAIQNESHYQEIREYGPLHLLQFIQDDNLTFHPLKAIQDESHYQEICLFKITIIIKKFGHSR